MRRTILCTLALLAACRSMPDTKTGEDGLTDGGNATEDND